jgi:hypothetical protein
MLVAKRAVDLAVPHPPGVKIWILRLLPIAVSGWSSRHSDKLLSE